MTQTKQPKTASKSRSYTPGPWAKGNPCEVIEGAIAIYGGPTGEVVADVWRQDTETQEQQEANARLIAKAPEMYELLGKIKKTVETAASKADKQEVCAVLLEVVLPHLGEEARRIKAEIDGE